MERCSPGSTTLSPLVSGAESAAATEQCGPESSPAGSAIGSYTVTAKIGPLHAPCLGADNSGMILAVIAGVALVAIGAIFLFLRLTRSEAAPIGRAELLDRMNKVL